MTSWNNLTDQNTNLTIEQQFKLEVLSKQVKNLNREQAQEYLLEMFRQQMVRDNIYKELLKQA